MDINESVRRDEKVMYSKVEDRAGIATAHGKSCNAVIIPKNATREYCVRRIRQIIADYIPEWTPEDLRDRLTPEIASELGLWPLIKHLRCPDELDPKQDLRFVAWELYSETRNISEVDLIHALFREVASGVRLKFPKSYFFGWKGILRTKAVFKFFMNDYAITRFQMSCIQDAYEVFGSSQIYPLLKRCNIDRLVRDRFGLPLNFLHICLGADADDVAYYNSFFGTNKNRYRTTFLLDSDRVQQLNGGSFPPEYVDFLAGQKV